MTIFMVFVCFTSGEGQTAQCHPAYPKQYASADECEAFSQRDPYLKSYLNGVLRFRWPLVLGYFAVALGFLSILLPGMGTELFPDANAPLLREAAPATTARGPPPPRRAKSGRTLRPSA